MLLIGADLWFIFWFWWASIIGGQRGGAAVPRPPPLFAKSGLKMHPRESIFQNFLEHNNIQRGHNVRKYGMYGNVKKMYGIVRKESWCTVRTKICTDVRNSRKKIELLLRFSRWGMFFRDQDYCLKSSFRTTLIVTFSIFCRINY